MAVTVRVGSALSRLFGGQRVVQTQGSTVREALDRLGVLGRLCDETGKIRPHFNIHVNGGEDIRLLQELDTPVGDGDEIAVLSAIAGGAQVERKVWLTFPRELVDRPLIWEVGHKFAVVTNIRQASVSKEVGIVGLELSGDEDQVWRAIEFLQEAGVSVEPVEQDVVE